MSTKKQNKTVQMIKKLVQTTVKNEVNKQMKPFTKAILEGVKKQTKIIVDHKVEEIIEGKIMKVLLENGQMLGNNQPAKNDGGLTHLLGGSPQPSAPAKPKRNPQALQEFKKQKLKQLGVENDPIWGSIYEDIEPGADEPISPEALGDEDDVMGMHNMGSIPESLPPSQPIQEQNMRQQVQQHAQQNMGALNPQQAGGVQYNQAPSAPSMGSGRDFIPGQNNQLNPGGSGIDPTLGVSPSSAQVSVPVDVKSEMERMKQETREAIRNNPEKYK